MESPSNDSSCLKIRLSLLLLLLLCHDHNVVELLMAAEARSYEGGTFDFN